MRQDYKEELIKEVIRVYKVEEINLVEAFLHKKSIDQLQEMLNPANKYNIMFDVKGELIRQINKMKMELKQKPLSQSELESHEIGSLKILRDKLMEERRMG